MPQSTAPPLAADRLDRALGAYLGFAIGDALGATVEFMTEREIAAALGSHQRIVGGGWLKLRPGQVTDDTTMALALGDAVQEMQGRSPPGWHLPTVAQHFVQWLRSGPVDCGNTCRRGIRRFMADGSLSGGPREADGGNGALMRNLPVVLATLDDDAAFEQWSLDQARITHHHPLSDAATLALGRMAGALVRGEPWAAATAHAHALVAAHRVFAHTPWPGRASAYVVDTVQTVLHHVLAIDDFEACLVAVVNRGDDADTTGALAGMLAGARCGATALPAHWLRALEPATVQAITLQVPALLCGLPQAG